MSAKSRKSRKEAEMTFIYLKTTFFCTIVHSTASLTNVLSLLQKLNLHGSSPHQSSSLSAQPTASPRGEKPFGRLPHLQPSPLQGTSRPERDAVSRFQTSAFPLAEKVAHSGKGFCDEWGYSFILIYPPISRARRALLDSFPAKGKPFG